MKYRVFIVLFMLLIFGVGGLSLFFNNRSTVSEIENRQLATFPTLSREVFWDGSYFQDIITYYGDHFVYREKLLMASKFLERFTGIQGKEQVEIVLVDNNDVLEIETEEINRTLENIGPMNKKIYNYIKRDSERYMLSISGEAIEEEEPMFLEQLEITEDQEFTGQHKNNLLIIEDQIYEIFGYSKKSCQYYAEVINNYQKTFENEMKVYSIVVPSHIEFLQSKKYRRLSASQADAINIINQEFDEAIEPVNVYDALGEHYDEYIYFRSDHHWTALGAYYAYTAFAKKIGEEPYPLDAFEKVELDGFLGYLHHVNFNQKVENNPDTVEVYMPFVESEYSVLTEGGRQLTPDVINMQYAKTNNKYMVFLSGDNPLSVINTDVDNGRKILVFKDSYGNAFIPYLMSHYDEIHIIDPRHFQEGAASYAIEHGIQETLFLNSAVIVAGHQGFAKNVERVSY